MYVSSLLCCLITVACWTIPRVRHFPSSGHVLFFRQLLLSWCAAIFVIPKMLLYSNLSSIFVFLSFYHECRLSIVPSLHQRGCRVQLKQVEILTTNVFSLFIAVFQALEYAKSVPKPKVAPRRLPAEDSPTSTPPNRTQSRNPSRNPSQPASKKASAASLQREAPPSQADVEIIDLQKLQERHEAERQKVAQIRQQLESVRWI